MIHFKLRMELFHLEFQTIETRTVPNINFHPKIGFSELLETVIEYKRSIFCFEYIFDKRSLVKWLIYEMINYDIKLSDI